MLYLNGLIRDIHIAVDVRGCAQQAEMTAAAARAIADDGACAVFLGGDIGKLLRMPFSDRVSVTEHVIEQCKQSGKPIIVECGALAAEQTQALLHLAAEEKADAVSLMMPMFFGVSAREMEAYCETMLQLVPEEMDAYFRNDRRFSSNCIGAALFNDCVNRFPQLKGLIDDTASAEKAQTLAGECAGCCIAVSAAFWRAAAPLGFRAFID